MKRTKLLALFMAGAMTIGAIGVPAIANAYTNTEEVDECDSVDIELGGEVEGTEEFLFCYPGNCDTVNIEQNAYTSLGEIKCTKQAGKIFDMDVKVSVCYLTVKLYEGSNYCGALTKQDDFSTSVKYVALIGSNGNATDSVVYENQATIFENSDVANGTAKKLGIKVLDEPAKSGYYRDQISFYVEVEE